MSNKFRQSLLEWVYESLGFETFLEFINAFLARCKVHRVKEQYTYSYLLSFLEENTLESFMNGTSTPRGGFFVHVAYCYDQTSSNAWEQAASLVYVLSLDLLILLDEAGVPFDKATQYQERFSDTMMTEFMQELQLYQLHD
jgi:hypothetical protein